MFDILSTSLDKEYILSTKDSLHKKGYTCIQQMLYIKHAFIQFYIKNSLTIAFSDKGEMLIIFLSPSYMRPL